MVEGAGAELLDFEEGATDAAEAQVGPDELLPVEDAAGMNEGPGEAFAEAAQGFERCAGERPREKAQVLSALDGQG